MDRAQALESLRLSMNGLIEMPDEMVDRLFGICEMARLKKGGLFARAGEVPTRMGFNLDGLFRLFYIDDEGRDLTKGFSTPGKFLVSYSAMAEGRPSYFSIEALAEADILRFEYRRWLRMAEEDGRWYRFFFKLVESVYIMKEMRERSFLLDDAATRYLAFRRDYPGLERKIKLYHVASFLGISPEALSRIRKRLGIDLDQ